jgi:hypothetical protein
MTVLIHESAFEFLTTRTLSQNKLKPCNNHLGTITRIDEYGTTV